MNTLLLCCPASREQLWSSTFTKHIALRQTSLEQYQLSTICCLLWLWRAVQQSDIMIDNLHLSPPIRRRHQPLLEHNLTSWSCCNCGVHLSSHQAHLCTGTGRPCTMPPGLMGWTACLRCPLHLVQHSGNLLQNLPTSRLIKS